MDLQTSFRFAVDRLDLDLASLGRKRVSGSSLSSDPISAKGLKLTNNSKSVRATAISGLWFGSVNLEGSFLWSSSARGLDG